LNKKIELFVSILTLASVIVIIIPAVYTLSPPELQAIYIFDLGVVIILVWDFYMRLRESGQGSRFLLTHCYEIPAMLPMIFFVSLENEETLIGAALLSLRLVRLFRIIQLFLRTIKLFEGRSIVYHSIFCFGS
jgi:voltage-gated potassium channel